MINLAEYEKLEVDGHPGLFKLRLKRPEGDSPSTPAPMNPRLMKKISVKIEAFKADGEAPTMQKYFFNTKTRALDPKKPDNNLPKGVLTCLGALAVGEQAWFELSPELQNNEFIQNYPVEPDPLYLKLEVTSVVRTKEVDPNDFGSYVAVGEVCREEGNQFFHGGKYTQAATQYQKGALILKNLPKKFLEGAEGEDNRAKAEAVKIRLLNNLAWCSIKLKDYTKALDAAEQALAIDPDNQKASFRKARALELTKDFEKAGEIYRMIKMEGRLESVKKMQRGLEVQLGKSLARALR